MAQTFFVDEEVKENYELDAIITVVDAKYIGTRLLEERPKGMENECLEQVRHCEVAMNRAERTCA